MHLQKLHDKKTDLTKVNFFKTSLSDIDFSSCRIDGILVSENLNELKGASINAAQAVDIIKYIGIKINDEVIN